MRRVLSLVIFCVLLFSMVGYTNEVLIDKSYNRYYMLEYELEQRDEAYDVQIFGSCHAYTSFNPLYLIETYEISAYNMSNPGESIPVTYLRMLEQFKKDTPEVALVEIWGVNPYETYDTTENILGGYMQSNLELLPLSIEKIEVINDFDTLDMIDENFHIAKYKDRLLSLSLTVADFNYSFELAKQIYDPEGNGYIYNEMEGRFVYNGYKAYPTVALQGYAEMQGDSENESLEVEPDIMKYVEKTIDLCEEYDVELIFYRAPYRSTDNELKKVNYLEEFFFEKQVPFFDLEKLIEYNYNTDFYDYEHLSYTGAYKSTIFLSDYIVNAVPGLTEQTSPEQTHAAY